MAPAWCQGGGESPAWGTASLRCCWDDLGFAPGCCCLSPAPYPLILLLWLYRSGSCCHSQNGKIRVPDAVPSKALVQGAAAGCVSMKDSDPLKLPCVSLMVAVGFGFWFFFLIEISLWKSIKGLIHLGENPNCCLGMSRW